MQQLKQGPKKSYCLLIALSPFVVIFLLTTWLVIS